MNSPGQRLPLWQYLNSSRMLDILEPRVIMPPCQRYGRQIMASWRIQFLSQKLWDSGRVLTAHF